MHRIHFLHLLIIVGGIHLITRLGGIFLSLI